MESLASPQYDATVDEMEDLASPQYDATPAAIRGAFSALSAVRKISKNLVAYPASLLVVTQHLGGTDDPRADDLGEAHAGVVLQLLKLTTDSN